MLRITFGLAIPIILIAFILATVLWSLWFLIGVLAFTALLLLYINDISQQKHAILRNFPIVGHGRYLADWLRPKLYQYFVEPDYDGRPFSRIERSVVYQRAKKETDTTPFGTQHNVYDVGYEWIGHSINALEGHSLEADPRVKVGGSSCTQPYMASVLNISAMSYGSLSKAAIEALNGGAKLGGFAHNTGEGGISPYHLSQGGDIIYQIGTGYFGCRGEDGKFSDELFTVRSAHEQVKMIEIKLSQGAKPGHGGILPAAKVTPEIAEIRNVPMGKDVNSPPYHTAFTTPVELLRFVDHLRTLSGGKPVGFKLCVGQKHEFIAICKAMIETGIKPDFISVDGGEGGTGAAPLEFSNSVGMPMEEGLSFVYNCLIGFNIKKEIQLIAAGKIVTGFHIFRAIGLGADICYSARGMMMALGCIQALECNRNTCPTGVATQDPKLMKGLVVEDKKVRVYQFHKNTVKSFIELMAASGITHPDQINRSHITRRIEKHITMRFTELFPYTAESSLLDGNRLPPHFSSDWHIAQANSFRPRFEQVFIEED